MPLPPSQNPSVLLCVVVWRSLPWAFVDSQFCGFESLLFPAPPSVLAGELPGEEGNRAGERQPDERGPEEQAEAGEHAAGAQVGARLSPVSQTVPLGLDSRPDR